MNSVVNLLIEYGWKQVNTGEEVSHVVFIKSNEQQLDEISVKLKNDNTFDVVVPMKNSEFSYKNNIKDVEKYLEQHLKNLQS